MKKLFLLLICVILISGCAKEEVNTKEKVKRPEVKPVEVTKYEDKNNTPIGLYSLNGNTLTKYTTVTKKAVIEEDLGVFQVYPSNEDKITLNKGFGESYYDTFNNYKKDTNLKVGFNLKFHLSSTGEDVSYNILSPNDCMNRWEHFMNYLYDDYANRGKGFYSHIENNEYNSNTLFTAIKIQSSYQVGEVDSKILLTVFTYDTEDDFDENKEYRGNSKYTMTICLEGRKCE